jgi:asparagine synthase (glutamine-hydrolysing)
MCGFVGRIVPPGVDEPRPLQACVPWLARRGPDSQRLWSSRDHGDASGGTTELLHARLAIVDFTERAHQPMWHPERRVAVVLVGEIFNYKVLRADLASYSFTTESDTEVVLATYVARGLVGLRDLRGFFTLAICDLGAGRLLLVRDPIGKKPLFIANWGGQVLFGSSLVPLVAAAAVRPAIDATTASFYWRREFPPPNRTLLAGASPVPPGTIAVFDLTGNRLANESCRPNTGPRYAGEHADEVAEQVAGLLRAAVAARLHNNPSPSILLSGGIDSTVIAAILAEEFGAERAQLRAYTLGAVLPMMYDELFARYAARRLGLRLDILRPHRAAATLGEQVAHYIALQDEPLGMLAFVPLSRLIGAVRQHSRVVFAGDGGDELFLGYDETTRWADPAAHPPGDGPAGVGEFATGPDLPEWAGPWARDTMSTALVGHQFAKVDRATAEQAVEARCPFLDWDLMSYARTIPCEMLISQGRSKVLLKNMLSGWPSWFVHRRKVGFAYNLRWAWRASGFAGLRELVDEIAVHRFAAELPAELACDPARWTSRAIFRNFPLAWRLACWSGFERRLDAAVGGGE